MHNTKPRNLFPSVRSICSYYSTGKYLVNTASALIKLMSKNNQLNQPGSLMYAMCDQLILLLTECGKMEELQEIFISFFPWNRNNCSLFESGVLNKLLTIVIVIKHQGKYCKLKYIQCVILLLLLNSPDGCSCRLLANIPLQQWLNSLQIFLFYFVSIQIKIQAT